MQGVQQAPLYLLRFPLYPPKNIGLLYILVSDSSAFLLNRIKTKAASTKAPKFRIKAVIFHVQNAELLIEDATSYVEDVTFPIENATFCIEDAASCIEDVTFRVEDAESCIKDFMFLIEHAASCIEDVTFRIENAASCIEDVAFLSEAVTSSIRNIRFLARNMATLYDYWTEIQQTTPIFPKSYPNRPSPAMSSRAGLMKNKESIGRTRRFENMSLLCGMPLS